MSRRRSRCFVESRFSSELHGAFMEASACRTDAELLEGDEELLCSVRDITEHLGRNISLVLDTALSDIRKMVSIRIRVLKMELREKSQEIETLKARLESQESSQRETPRLSRSKAAFPTVKKENIDAICDYLMKDKNSRGEAEASLSLWPDSSAPGEDIFNLLPSGSKRSCDYEWMNPMEYQSELKVMKESDGENSRTCERENDVKEEDSTQTDCDEPEQTSAPLSVAQTPEFSMEAQSSQTEGESPLTASTDTPDAGPFPSHTFICSLCGIFCPDSVFLEEHVKLIHPESDALKVLQPNCSPPPDVGNTSGQNEDLGVGVSLGVAPGRREIKTQGGYKCGDCGRHFNYLGNLRQHQRIHTGEKPFMCPECGERFRHAARLKSHRLVHSGAQSPFPCPQCGKGFSVLSGLKRHQRVHTGESPYACPQCGRRFKELGNLYTHQRIHSGATPYCCQQCGRSFRHLGTYKSHRCTPPLAQYSNIAPNTPP